MDEFTAVKQEPVEDFSSSESVTTGTVTPSDEDVKVEPTPGPLISIAEAAAAVQDTPEAQCSTTSNVQTVQGKRKRTSGNLFCKSAASRRVSLENLKRSASYSRQKNPY